MNDPVLTQQHGNILEITLNRPDAYNALSPDMMKMQGISDCAAHPDGQEGIQAFVEKRKPSF